MISEAVRDVMWRRAGLFRSREGLTEAVSMLEKMMPTAPPTSLDDWRTLNLVTVARLIAVAALRREESRGGHFREDFPHRDDDRWRIHVVDRAEHKEDKEDEEHAEDNRDGGHNGRVPLK